MFHEERFWIAHRQFVKWQANGEPEGESPKNGSLPRALDGVVGLSIGGSLSFGMIISAFTDWMS